ncbi:MAG: hypothetical protein RLZZ37_625 [Actinomycetota bacterium]|jgi:uncharacterized protein Yka (UPF0111/DUF47 family)
MKSKDAKSLIQDFYIPLAQELVKASDFIIDIVNTPKESRAELSRRVSEIENQADKFLVKIVKKISKVDSSVEIRDQFLDLANYLDDAIDSLEEASDLTILHNVGEFPQGTNDLVQAVKNLAEITLMNLNLIGDEEKMDQYFALANKIEDDGDRIHRRITALLFNGSYEAIDVLRIVGIINLFEDSLDDMARVARSANSLT